MENREYILPMGDWVTQSQKAVVIRFSGQRIVLSTGALGGGLRTDLTGVFDYNDCDNAGVCSEMLGETMLEHQKNIAIRLGLDPYYTTGLDTAANMDNLARSTMVYENFSVTALVTAGADGNAARAGDPSSLHEHSGSPCFILPGTINIFLFIDAKLSSGAMVEAMMTATEAKSATLQELMVPSKYSCGLATGTGTDGIVIVSNAESSVDLYNAGKHFKLGELLAAAVKKTVREALYRQSGLCSQSQHNLFARLKRFGITPDQVSQNYDAFCPNDQERCYIWMSQLSCDGFMVVWASMYAHLLDQLDWELLTLGETTDWAEALMSMMFCHYGCQREPRIPFAHDKEGSVQQMVQTIQKGLAEVLRIHNEAEKLQMNAQDFNK
ncbi:adenosylcobinamide amidohydrolase [Oscillospiraceae bacterium PP1C4]